MRHTTRVRLWKPSSVLLGAWLLCMTAHIAVASQPANDDLEQRGPRANDRTWEQFVEDVLTGSPWVFVFRLIPGLTMNLIMSRLGLQQATEIPVGIFIPDDPTQCVTFTYRLHGKTLTGNWAYQAVIACPDFISWSVTESVLAACYRAADPGSLVLAVMHLGMAEVQRRSPAASLLDTCVRHAQLYAIYLGILVARNAALVALFALFWYVLVPAACRVVIAALYVYGFVRGEPWGQLRENTYARAAGYDPNA